MSLDVKILSLSSDILEVCSGKTHADIMNALFNVVVIITNHANNDKFTSDTIRSLHNLQDQLIHVKSVSEFKPKKYDIN